MPFCKKTSNHVLKNIPLTNESSIKIIQILSLWYIDSCFLNFCFYYCELKYRCSWYTSKWYFLLILPQFDWNIRLMLNLTIKFVPICQNFSNYMNRNWKQCIFYIRQLIWPQLFLVRTRAKIRVL